MAWLSGLSQSTQATSSEKASLPSSLTKYFSYQTTKRAGFKLLREAARSNNSLDFTRRFGSGKPLPLYYNCN
jgi:hypothetical protein